MKKSAIFSKAFYGVIVAALALTTLTVSPASAAGVTYASGDSLVDRSVSINQDLTANGEFELPAGVNGFSVDSNFWFSSNFFATNAGKSISVSKKVYGPDNQLLVSNNNLDVNGTPNLYFCEQNNSNCINTNTQTPPATSLVAKAEHVSGNANLYVNVWTMTSSPSQTPPPLTSGTYRIEIAVTVDGVAVAVDGTDVNAQWQSVHYSLDVPSYTAEAATDGLNLNIGACVDSSKVVAGDVVTPTMYVNGVAQNLQGWNINANTRADVSTGNRGMGGNQATSFTINGTVNGNTFDDITNGLALRMYKYLSQSGGDYAAGDVLDWQIAIVDQDGVDVTGSCVPGTPGKPTLAYNSMQNSLTATLGTAATFADGHVCNFFKSTDLNTVLGTAYAWSSMPGQPTTCSLSRPTAGVNYVVKIQGMWYDFVGQSSPASDAVLVPAPGYNISTPVSGVTDVAGKVSVVSSDVANITAASNVRVVADGLGGTYRLFQLSAAQSCPPNCGPPSYNFKLRQTNASGFVSSFAGSGEVAFTPTGSSAYSTAVGFYGTAKDQWTILAPTTDTALSKGQLEIVQGTNTSASTSSIKVNFTELDSTCAELGAGITAGSSASGTNVSATPISASTAKQLILLTCFKPVTLSDNQTVIYAPTPAVVSLDGANALTLVKALGEQSANANSTQVSYSVNPSATSADAAVTFFVTKRNVTARTNGIDSGTVAAREIVRLKGDLTSTVVTSAWASSGTTISNEPTLVAPSVNNGDFFVILRTTGMPLPTFKLAKVSASGTAGTQVDFTNDKAIDLPIGNLIWPIGVQSASASALQVAAIANPVMPSDPYKTAVVSIKTATGAGTTGEIVSYTQVGLAGLSSIFVIEPSTSDVNWWFTDAAAGADKMSIYKWRNHLYVKPSGPVPAVSSKNLEYATNTPAAGTKVTFTGTNLDLATAVKFGTVAATIGTKTATSLEVTVPAGTGTVAITIESANGDGSGGNFTYVGASKVAQDVTLDAGASSAKVGDADRTLSATVSMTGYTAVASLTYSSTTPSVCSVTGTTLKFLTKGTCSVKATQAGSTWAAEGSDTKSITVTGATPTVSAQVSGKASNTPDAGTKVTITGTNLGEVDSVKFGTVVATIGTRSATSLEVSVPAGSKGIVNITLAYSGGTVTAGTFEYVGASKVAQTVTLNSGAATAAVGDADRTLSATVSMTGYTAVASLTYSSTTPSVCSVTGTTLKFLTKGTCSVKATQAGSTWAAEGVATASIAVSGPADQVITVRTVQVGEKQINPDGIFISANASSGLNVTLVFSTPSVCKKGTYSAFHVINLKTGACKISVVQQGNAEWAPVSKLVTYTVTPAGTKKFVDAGNVGAPVALGISGAKTNVLSEVVSFKKSTGALTINSKGVWVGPIVATASFKIDGKSYTCTLKYGTLKAVSAKLANTQKTFAPATSFCAGTKTADKAAVAALKKLSAPVTVKITVWRDLHNPVKYATRGTQIERAIYVTIG